jgi:lipid II:glycine glycyltransferase (peptidoglycan interpeptide bridge formation enzyme)
MEENVLGEAEKKNSEDHKKAAERVASRNQAESSGLKNTFFMFRPYKKSFAKEGIFQPRIEWWLDLSDTEENIYNNFHKDHRYSIRRAEKEGIEVEIVNLGKDLSSYDREKYFAEFWKLMRETGERDRFHLYDQEYYKAIFTNPTSQHSLRLVFTKTSDSTGGKKYLSVALVVISGKVANLVFAGSVSERRELGFNHLMQWEAIKESKKHGCEIYNFGGIYENGYGKKSLEGVTKFKKKFGGYAHFHGNFIDLPIKNIKYMAYLLYKIF